MNMFFRRRPLAPLDDRGPLRVMFVLTSMPVGGQETLTVALVRGMDRARFAAELCCLKHLGPLGEALAREVPAHSGLLAGKWDVRVLGRLVRLLRQRRTDAVVTVGAGDKMFWGRLAAWLAGTPVIASALHTSGHPDRVGRLNRPLAAVTDAFIAVAQRQARYLAEHEGCTAAKVRVIPNGIDIERFRPRQPAGALRDELGIAAGTPVVGIVAALRPEKNHELFLRAAALVRREVPGARFLVIGDGPQLAALESLARRLGLAGAVRFLGTRADVPALLSLIDVVLLTSHTEASPVSLLEAMASEKPVVATRVGSVEEVVLDGRTGFLVPPGAAEELARRTVELLGSREPAAAMGRAGRQRVLESWSLAHMVEGYQDLLAGIYAAKAERWAARRRPPLAPAPPDRAGLGVQRPPR
jgi:glycosyltransferase involved in cell wall biosynthesis